MILATVLAVALPLTAGARPASSTPQVTSSDKTVKAGLLRASDLGGFGALESIPLKKAKLFEDPDPRGPCGAKIKPPRLSKGATVVFSLPGGIIGDSVIRVPEAQGRSLMDVMTRDAIVGCPPYTSTTNTGATQTVASSVVDLPPVGDQRVGATAVLTVGGQNAYVGVVRMRRGRYLDFAEAISPAPVPADVVRVLAERMGGALQRLP